MNYLVSEQLQHAFFIFMHLIKKKHIKQGEK